MEGKSMSLESLAAELEKEGTGENIIQKMAPKFDYKDKHKILDSSGYICENYAVAIRNYEYEDDNQYDMFMEVLLYDKKKYTITTLKSEATCMKYYFNDTGFYDDRNGWGEQITRHYDIDYICKNKICTDYIHHIKNIKESEGILRFDITDSEGDKKYATYAIHLDFGAIKKETCDEEMEKFSKKRL